MNATEFRAAFSGGKESTEGYYAFQNVMNYENQHFDEIIVNLEILQKQIEFVLHNYTIEDQSIFDFFKRLESALIKFQHSEPGYDESKQFCGFIYQIFSGWDVIDGYRDYDLIEKMIDDI